MKQAVQPSDRNAGERPSLSVVVPCYNEEHRIERTIVALLDNETIQSDSCELIFVDDGSSDRTPRILAQLTPSFARVVTLGTNQGKGAAVRTGVHASSGDAVVFMDADLATDLSGLDPLLDTLQTADVAIGSRAVPGSVVRGAPTSRSIMGRTFNRIVKGFTGLPFDDTQCGFKAFRRRAAEDIFGHSSVNGYGFDVELLVIAQRIGLTVVEVPVTWTAIPGSQVRPIRDSLGMLGQVVEIRRRHGWRPAIDTTLALAR